MKKGFEIVRPVLEAFRGLPQRLADLFGKADDWYRSHGYDIKKNDALANGNLSAVDHFLRMADEYEAAAPGAGQMLGDTLAAELRVRYSSAPAPTDDRQIRHSLNTEFFEAMRELDKKDLSEQSELELSKTDAELSHIEKAIADARAHVRAELRKKQTKQNGEHN